MEGLDIIEYGESKRTTLRQHAKGTHGREHMGRICPLPPTGFEESQCLKLLQ